MPAVAQNSSFGQPPDGGVNRDRLAPVAAAFEVSPIPAPGRATDWLSDAVPHLVYGLATAAVVHNFDHD